MSSRLEEFHLEALPDPAVWCPRCSRDRAPSRSASSARGPWPRRRLQTCPDGSRRSRHERPAPGSAPDNDGRPPERCDRRPSGCPTAASHHSLSGYRPAAPAEESSSPRTSDSRVCRGYPRGWPQSPQSTVHPLQPLPWLAFTRLKASQTSRFEIENGFASSTGSSRHQMASVGQWPWLNNAAPSLQLHYRAFVTTTGCSALRCASVLSPSRSAPLVACPFTTLANSGRRDAAQVLTFRTTA